MSMDMWAPNFVPRLSREGPASALNLWDCFFQSPAEYKTPTLPITGQQ
jgi:hypothetical protein